MSGVRVPRWAVRAWNGLSLAALAALGVYVGGASAEEALVGLGGAASQPCASWLDSLEPRWVSLQGCRLDLRGASVRTWKRPAAAPDAGLEPLELYIPVSGTEFPELHPRVVLATTDDELNALVKALDATPRADIDAYIEANRQRFIAALAPERLDGLLEVVPSFVRRKALAAVGEPQARVLVHHGAPRLANALFGVAVGLGLVGLAVFRAVRAAKKP